MLKGTGVKATRGVVKGRGEIPSDVIVCEAKYLENILLRKFSSGKQRLTHTSATFNFVSIYLEIFHPFLGISPVYLFVSFFRLLPPQDSSKVNCY